MKSSRTVILLLFSLLALTCATVTYNDRGPDSSEEGFVTFTFKAKDEDGQNAKKVKVQVKGGALNKRMKIKADLSGEVFSATTKKELSAGSYKWRIWAKPKKSTKSSWQTLTVTGGTPAPTTTENTPPPTPTVNTPPPTPTVNTPAPTPDVDDDVIENAKSDILTLTTNNTPLKAKFLRLGFHDCVGGCDGCVDLEEPDNRGLEIPIAALEDIVTQYSGSLSRADIWALATIVGAESSQRNNEALDYTFDFVGRVNCEDTGVDVCVNVPDGCDPSRNGPIRAMPSPNLNTQEVLHFFSNEFGFGAEETVALMGAHTIGEAVVENSGFDGQWVGNNERLNNQYYRAMIGDDGDIDDWFDAPGWNQVTITNNDPDIPTRTQWHRGQNNSPDADIMLNTDIALVRDFDGQIDTSDGTVSCRFRGGRNPCPAAQQTIEYMAKFKFSNSEWLSAFRDVLTKMVKNGYSTTIEETESESNLFQ